ncbi:MAG TPA: ATP-grasp domain-containing protein [Bacteroidales bacterium]|nr:ATP-grasp domain-containing protein [Bacteroidales bacterium]HOU95415.1 ATP-grasp domain-containing protein [Bacteroidales bacterium]HQG36306.1 ATP-grasp domain-containing protein [Bacteroidales bacterium]HQG52510.1 ATP-grasp domain-containing protein [Bacteroidales bacterium]HQJ20061.1 ATP-grasp domain-containing protein [Bacteroidales bacterium]
MQRFLIIGGSILQLPAIQTAKDLGLYVGVVDRDPSAPGRKIADKFFQVSTNDIDGIVRLARDFLPDGVMTLATDMPVRSVASVNECLGLPGISSKVALNATDKVAMMECFKDYEVPIPWFKVVSSKIEFENLLKTIWPPFILKPNDSSGSRGVILVNDKEKADKGYDYAKAFSNSGLVLVEEYMQGPEVSVEIITYNGKSSVLAVTDKITTGPPYFVEMGHSQPSLLPFETVEKIKEVAIKAVKAIEIDNSPSHVEIKVTHNGPKLVELGARLGGDCITTHLVPLSTGIDMVKASIQLALGQSPDIEKKLDKGVAIRYLNSREGILKEIKGFDILNRNNSVKHFEIVKQKGDIIKSIQSSNDRVGYVICQSNTPLEAIRLCEKIIKKVKVITQ